ncbi:transcription repressor NadR [Haloimpatiens sp. FM7315]|uniref:transcription repressor NadR n=1 Tax=Haloimpatiens sp. FM7315 TaxID=3298609 RepID=UPI0035A38E42
MDSEKRRTQILNLLNSKNHPIKGVDLAKEFQVSRQVIVQDIALLRAKGKDIISTPQGYMVLNSDKNNNLVKTIVCRHLGYEAIKAELSCIVDMGGKVLDVIVEHPVYGEIKSPLMINSRLDIENFLDNLKNTKAEPLSTLTNGIHLHSIEVKDEEIFLKIKTALKENGFLV